MIVHQVYAQILENEIKNVLVCENYELANWLARATYGDAAFAVDCLQYPCSIGDKYRDGIFFRVNPNTGEEIVINPLPTQEQQVRDLQAENQELLLVVSDMIGGAYNA